MLRGDIMVIFKCKMCGGELNIHDEHSVATCAHCGTKQTLPRLNNEKISNMYDRANHFRRNNEFDKAMATYENILLEDPTDSEAYWSILLCKYGVEYVEDVNNVRVPTCNRTQLTSIFLDEDYKLALEYADIAKQELYEKEAKLIDRIQKEIIAISSNEKPFDVFLCYKETDEKGRRTQDSVYANQIYHQLLEEGYKVFYSRITLEDIVGESYEPYIFAALNSAKAMVVIGTKKEYLESTWVRNEWSRYLKLIKNGDKKTLIPVYKDMDPYDLPEEFAHLQAVDASNLGFMMDLLRGIKKVISMNTQAFEVAGDDKYATVSSLLSRIDMFLEDRNFSDARSYCNRVLDIEPRNAEAFLKKYLAEYKISSLKELSQTNDSSIFCGSDFKRAVEFADEDLKKSLEKIKEDTVLRIAYEQNKKIYTKAEQLATMAKKENSISDMYSSYLLFNSIANFEDSSELSKEIELEYIAPFYSLVTQAKPLKKASDIQKDIVSLGKIHGYKDTNELIISLKQQYLLSLHGIFSGYSYGVPLTTLNRLRTIVKTDYESMEQFEENFDIILEEMVERLEGETSKSISVLRWIIDFKELLAPEQKDSVYMQDLTEKLNERAMRAEGAMTLTVIIGGIFLFLLILAVINYG